MGILGKLHFLKRNNSVFQALNKTIVSYNDTHMFGFDGCTLKYLKFQKIVSKNSIKNQQLLIRYQQFL